MALPAHQMQLTVTAALNIALLTAKWISGVVGLSALLLVEVAVTNGRVALPSLLTTVGSNV